MLTPVARTVRSILAGAPDGTTATNRAIAKPYGAPGWFGPDSAAWQVHGSVSTFLGGVRALLLQALHPRALAGVEDHSSYRHDPLGRLQRTGAFIAATTFGSAAQAQQTVDTITRIHATVSGTTPDGKRYAATEPDLLTWVHIALVDSMLESYLRFGTNGPLDADAYVADMATVGEAMGVPTAPREQTELRAAFRDMAPELSGGERVSDVRKFVLAPPLPLLARPAYAVLARAAENSLPPWAQQLLETPRRSPQQQALDDRLATALLTTLQQALVESPARAAARERLGIPYAEMTRLAAARSRQPTQRCEMGT